MAASVWTIERYIFDKVRKKENIMLSAWCIFCPFGNGEGCENKNGEHCVQISEHASLLNVL